MLTAISRIRAEHEAFIEILFTLWHRVVRALRYGLDGLGFHTALDSAFGCMVCYACGTECYQSCIAVYLLAPEF